MDLQNASKVISQKLADYRNELLRSREEISTDIERTTKDLKDASAMGDRSENAEFTAAVERLSQLNARMGNVMTQLKDVEEIEGEERYESIGMVVLYTTVCIKRLDTGESFVFKLYPGKVSKVEEGIVSVESMVGKCVWFKTKGSRFNIEHRVDGTVIEFLIEDIY